MAEESAQTEAAQRMTAEPAEPMMRAAANPETAEAAKMQAKDQSSTEAVCQ